MTDAARRRLLLANGVFLVVVGGVDRKSVV